MLILETWACKPFSFSPFFVARSGDNCNSYDIFQGYFEREGEQRADILVAIRLKVISKTWVFFPPSPTPGRLDLTRPTLLTCSTHLSCKKIWGFFYRSAIKLLGASHLCLHVCESTSLVRLSASTFLSTTLYFYFLPRALKTETQRTYYFYIWPHFEWSFFEYGILMLGPYSSFRSVLTA